VYCIWHAEYWWYIYIFLGSWRCGCSRRGGSSACNPQKEAETRHHGIYLCFCDSTKYWRMTQSIGVWHKVLAYDTKYWRMTQSIGVWHKVLVYDTKYWCMTHNIGVWHNFGEWHWTHSLHTWCWICVCIFPRTPLPITPTFPCLCSFNECVAFDTMMAHVVLILVCILPGTTPNSSMCF